MLAETKSSVPTKVLQRVLNIPSSPFKVYLNISEFFRVAKYVLCTIDSIHEFVYRKPCSKRNHIYGTNYSLKPIHGRTHLLLIVFPKSKILCESSHYIFGGLISSKYLLRDNIKKKLCVWAH